MDTMETIRVSIFDDNANLRESLAFVIQNSSGIELVGLNADASGLIEKIEAQRPDVVLMDIQMPEISGIEAVKLIKQHYPEIKVIMQTAFQDDDYIFESICNGANGYILKNTALDEYLDAIKHAFWGGAPLNSTIASKMLNLFRNAQLAEKKEFGLSEREKEILLCLVDGLSYKMISAKCSISYDTVRFHMKNIYQKLHVASMTEAVALAIKYKIT
jgi:DNA-binding NarL/FixJ family response regulator